MDNKRQIERLFDEVLNRGKLEFLYELIPEDYVDHSPVPGQEPGATGVRKKIEAMRAAFPDLQFYLEDIIAQDRMVAARYHWQGTQSGEFMGMPASGRKVDVKGMDFYRLKDGKLVEHWDSIDQLGLLTQLGAIPGSGDG
jgi:steroid delta-isomerase-like uncharacterized protein